MSVVIQCFSILRNLFLLIGGIALSCPVWAQSNTRLTAQRDHITNSAMQAIHTMYSWEFDRAEAMLKQLSEQYPQDPTGQFFLSSLHLWKYLASNRDEDLRRFLLANEQAVQRGEQALKADPNDSYIRTLLGSSFGYRALANARAENFIKASWDARSCYDYLNEVLRRNPNEYEAYVGMGIFQFVLGSIPTSVQWAVNLTGLRGDRDVGVKLLTIAAEKSRYFRNDATILLGLLAVYYKNDYTQGVKYLKGLLDQYPRNAGLLYALGNVESQLKKMPNAIGYFQRILNDESNKSFTIFAGFAHFRIGEAYYRLNEFEKAKISFQRFVKTVNDKTFRSIALLRLGVCYEMTGDRANAVKAYTLCRDDFSITVEDRWARRKAKEYLVVPMDEITKQYLRGENAVESLNFTQGQALLQPIIENAQYGAQASYFLGESYRLQGQYTQARTAYQKVIQMRNSVEAWLVPWAFYRLSQCSYAENKLEESRSYLEKAKVYSGYDFEEWLMFALERDVLKLK